MKEKKKILPALFLTMLKIGAFTFGGGYAMISILQTEFVVKKKWIEEEDFLDLVAIAESTPGPIAINSSTYIGYKMAGVLGSAVATLAMCLPSFVIIFLISLFFDQFLTLQFVANAFRGIQACVVYLIVSAGFRMAKKIKKRPFELTILCAAVLCTVLFSLLSVKFSTVFYILISAFLGWLFWFVRERGKEEKK